MSGGILIVASERSLCASIFDWSDFITILKIFLSSKTIFFYDLPIFEILKQTQLSLKLSASGERMIFW
jgi:hypothetical protein